MLVKLGENDVKTIEDFAGCVPDDLVGWSEKKDGETIKHDGFLDGHRPVARRGRGDDHGGARARRLDRGAGAAGRGRSAEDVSAEGE